MAERKILYSPGYGAGWSSWCSGSIEQKRFMCEYKPFIEHLEKGGTLSEFDMNEKFESVPVVKQFVADWKKAFPKVSPPYLGGIVDLRVFVVPDGDLYRITEYDGAEGVQLKSEDDGWM